MAGEPGEGQRASRYEDAGYRRSSAVQPLREITNLPNAFVEDLQELIRRSEAAAVIEPDLNTDGLQVRYFGGVGTTNHGLMLIGMPPLRGEPPAGTFANEHCYVAKDTKEPFALADLRLESIYMKDASRLEFDERGGLKDLWTDYPPKSP